METMELCAAEPPVTLYVSDGCSQRTSAALWPPVQQKLHDCNSIVQYSLCPTFMIIFMDLVLQTPPSWLSMPSIVPLDVAAADMGEEQG